MCRHQKEVRQQLDGFLGKGCPGKRVSGRNGPGACEPEELTAGVTKVPGEAREIKGRRGWGGEGLEGHWQALTADWQGLPLGAFEEERVIV